MGYYNNYTQDMFAVVLRADRTKPLQISPGLSNGWCRVIYNLCNTPLGELISGTICYDEGQSWDEKTRHRRPIGVCM